MKIKLLDTEYQQTKLITQKDVVRRLNELIGGKTFFYTAKSVRHIYFPSCSNNYNHSKLIGILLLFFAIPSNKFWFIALLSKLDKADYHSGMHSHPYVNEIFVDKEEYYTEFYTFLMQLPNDIHQVKITL